MELPADCSEGKDGENSRAAGGGGNEVILTQILPILPILTHAPCTLSLCHSPPLLNVIIVT